MGSVNHRTMGLVVGLWNQLHPTLVPVEENCMTWDGCVCPRDILEVVVKETGVNLIFLIADAILSHHGLPSKKFSETILHVIHNGGDTLIVDILLTDILPKLLDGFGFHTSTNDFEALLVQLFVNILVPFWILPTVVKGWFLPHLNPQ